MIYLDNASTSKPCRAAVEAAIHACEGFGNPSSLHRLGMDAEKLVKGARKSVADVLGSKPEAVLFTSGGTEANNTAIFGAAGVSRKRHAITTRIEHPSVLEPFAKLAEQGWRVDYIDVGADGIIDLNKLAAALDDETALVSIMHVNNETGSVQPVESASRLIRERAPGALFHVDAVQSFGKLPCSVKALGADLVSVSAHKINALKGCGALYVGARINPLIVGGGQQRNMRSGTENVVGIAAFGAACHHHMEDNREKVNALRTRLANGIMSQLDNVKYNGSGTDYSPYVLNMSFLGIKAEILLHSLETHGIFVSTGSACSSNKPMPSHVLTAMGCSRGEIGGAVRFSFDDNITETDIDTVIAAVCEEVTKIRKYMR